MWDDRKLKKKVKAYAEALQKGTNEQTLPEFLAEAIVKCGVEDMEVFEQRIKAMLAREERKRAFEHNKRKREEYREKEEQIKKFKAEPDDGKTIEEKRQEAFDKCADQLLNEIKLDIRTAKGVWVAGGFPLGFLRQGMPYNGSDVDCIITAEGQESIMEWMAKHYKRIRFNATSLVFSIDSTHCQKVQFFEAQTDVESVLDKFDLAPCRIAMGEGKTICTEDAQYAYDTGICRNSTCCNDDRREKYAKRGFKTDDLPHVDAKRPKWDLAEYKRASAFLDRLEDGMQALRRNAYKN